MASQDPPPDTDRFSSDGTPDERRQSKVLMEALAARKDTLGATAQLPADDRALSERILGEARRRSEQISASRNPAASSRSAVQGGERVSWWIWAAWVVVVVATALAFRFLL